MFKVIKVSGPNILTDKGKIFIGCEDQFLEKDYVKIKDLFLLIPDFIEFIESIKCTNGKVLIDPKKYFKMQSLLSKVLSQEEW